jgi:iron complex outermembrane receptor protein
VQSGPYIGGLPEPYGRGIGAVESYVVVDLNFGYSLRRLLPGLRFDLTVNNLFDHKHREYVGAPKIGRLSLARLSFSL